MSYLNSLRIHFAGTFFATPSTVNNDVRHFDNANFKPNFQLPGPGTTNGWWNPEGDGGFKLLCPATTVHYGDGTVAAAGSDLRTDGDSPERGKPGKNDRQDRGSGSAATNGVDGLRDGSRHRGAPAAPRSCPRRFARPHSRISGSGVRHSQATKGWASGINRSSSRCNGVTFRAPASSKSFTQRRPTAFCQSGSISTVIPWMRGHPSHPIPSSPRVAWSARSDLPLRPSLGILFAAVNLSGQAISISRLHSWTSPPAK